VGHSFHIGVPIGLLVEQLAAISLAVLSAVQTSNPPATFKQIRVILAPLFVGTLIGVLMGSGAVLLLKLLPSNYTHMQEILAFSGFALLGTLAGFIDTGKCFLAWLRFRKNQRSQGKSIDSD
jgi:hypothetical protein